MDWVYDAEEWARTRAVTVAGVTADGGEAIPDSDGYYRWHRNRTGPNKREVAAASSGGFLKLQWCYVSAVKENYPLDVPIPAGCEEVVVAVEDSDDELPDVPA